MLPKTFQNRNEDRMSCVGTEEGDETHLHPNNGVDEEEHGNQEDDVGQRLQTKDMNIHVQKQLFVLLSCLHSP